MVLEEGEFVEIQEGQTRLLVPRSSLNSKVPPKTPAFFNPAAKFSRDISVLAYKAFVRNYTKEKTFADGFAGVGARGIRVANEVEGMDHVYLNDVNTLAIDAAIKSAQLNSVQEKCTFDTNEICRFLLGGSRGGERFAIVDLDPFGTPARHLDCVLRSVLDGGLVSITATDTAVLAGIYPQVCQRRYYGRPLNCAYGNEIALRLLVSLVALTASRLDLGLKPVFCHASQHYLRVYAIVTVSNTDANSVLGNIGHVKHCFKCGYRKKSGDACRETCPLCQQGLAVGGPLWTGNIFERQFVQGMADSGPDKRALKLITASVDELDDIPFYYKVDDIAESLGTNPISVEGLISVLKSYGFSASHSALNSSAVKTNAELGDILKVVRSR